MIHVCEKLFLFDCQCLSMEIDNVYYYYILNNMRGVLIRSRSCLSDARGTSFTLLTSIEKHQAYFFFIIHMVAGWWMHVKHVYNVHIIHTNIYIFMCIYNINYVIWFTDLFMFVLRFRMYISSHNNNNNKIYIIINIMCAVWSSRFSAYVYMFYVALHPKIEKASSLPQSKCMHHESQYY